MFDRYTEDARKVIFLARYEASLLGSPALETDHLWLGLLRHNKKLVRRLAPQVTTEAIQERLTRNGFTGERASMAVEIPVSDAAKQALTNAAAEADSHGQKHITPEYLALGLLREHPAINSG
jgi:ATP-dependent Clp protease ATP-binding subunit ClpC